MAQLDVKTILKDISIRNKVTAEDVFLLRRSVYEDGLSSRHEVENLLIVQSGLTDASCTPEWSEFLIETVRDFLVYQEKPQGYVSSDNVAWLLGLVTLNGKVETKTEIDLLLHVLESSISVPEILGEFILKQVEDSIMTAQGPLAENRMKIGQVTKAHSDIVRRVLYAMGGHGTVSISQDEAEMLFNINDKSVYAYSDPSWNELFVKAITNYMMTASGYQVSSRQEALKNEAFLGDRAADIGGFMSRLLLNSLNEKFKVLTKGKKTQKNAKNEVDKINSLLSSDIAWLARRINHDGELHTNERALIECIQTEVPSIHPELIDVIHKKMG
jgi:hypothetical protein